MLVIWYWKNVLKFHSVHWLHHRHRRPSLCSNVTTSLTYCLMQLGGKKQTLYVWHSLNIDSYTSSASWDGLTTATHTHSHTQKIIHFRELISNQEANKIQNSFYLVFAKLKNTSQKHTHSTTHTLLLFRSTLTFINLGTIWVRGKHL